MNWIKASDQLPEKERAVLIYCKGGYNVMWWWKFSDEEIERSKHLGLDNTPKWASSRLIKEAAPDYKVTCSRMESLEKEDYPNIYWMYLPEAPHPSDDIIREDIESVIRILNGK